MDNFFFLKSDQYQLQPHQKYNVTQYEELGFSKLSWMKDDCTIRLPIVTTSSYEKSRSPYCVVVFSGETAGEIWN